MQAFVRRVHGIPKALESVLGYLDDLLLVPLGVLLALKMVPPAVQAESRERACEAMAAGKPVSRTAAVVIVLLWLLLAAVGVVVVVRVL